MSDIYRKVDPAVWDDPKFIDLGDDAQSIWLLLLTGPQVQAIPGLQLADACTLASARRWPTSRVEAALSVLVGADMVEFDAKLRVVRLPNAPKYNPPDNPSVLVGWWRLYQRLPPSPLKQRHVAALKASIDFAKYPGAPDKDPMKANFQAAWDATFGTVADTLSNTVSDTLLHTQSTSVISDQGTVITEQEQRKKKPQAPDGAGGDGQGSLSGLSSSKKPKKANSADVAKVIEHYQTRWIETRKPADGKPPTMTKADRAQAAALVRAHALEQAIVYVDRYLDDTDPWLAKVGYALAHVTSRVNGYRAAAPSGAKTKTHFAEPMQPAAVTGEADYGE